MKVDLLILEEMEQKWGLHVDPKGKYGINGLVKKTLRRKWRKVGNGWSLSRAIDEIVFSLVEFDEWRRTFENKHQDYFEGKEGIQRFGL